MNRYFKYTLLATFFAAVLLIVYLYFNSNRSINELIEGNENLLEELSIKNNLQRLQTGLATLESRTRGEIIRGTSTPNLNLGNDVKNIEESLKNLDTLQSEQLISPALEDLKKMVHRSIEFNRQILDTFQVSGKLAAERLANAQSGKQLMDSINALSKKIDNLHQQSVTELILQADTNVNKTRTIGSTLALIAAFATIFTFIYTTVKVRSQEKLILRLNASERQVRESARVKENFLANMSHEIRTPLNAILGFTALLQKRPLDKTSNEYVQTISRSGDHLLSIVNEILDLSKIEAGMMRIEKSTFDIREQLRSVKVMFASEALQKKLDIFFSVDPTIPEALVGDPVRLHQILVNLVGNAIKFTEKGSVRVNINNKGLDKNNISTEIEITDTGIGIDSQKLNSIFDRFQQAEDTMTRKFGGTGLGLTIVRELVELQNGTIEVGSDAGKGTCFRITIPYELTEQRTTTIAAAEHKQPVLQPNENFRVLVAEDNKINQQLIGILLKNRNISFDIVANGKEVLTQLMLKPYHLVLMDIQMPEMDGYSATSEIRHKLELNIPIIAMTAHALQGERDKCIVYGMNDYLPKPVREEQLDELIQQYAPGAVSTSDSYQVINTNYLQNVSAGDVDFQKTVAAQFIEAVPEELEAMAQAWQRGDREAVSKIAHNMRTTISVMGLNDVVAAELDALETNYLNEHNFEQLYADLSHTLYSALDEAKSFQSQI